MSAIRRGLCAATATLAALAALASIVSGPQWGDQLIAATAVSAAVAAWLWRAPRGVPQIRNWRHKREIQDLKAGMARLAAQVGVQGTEIAEMRRQRDSSIAGLHQALDALGIPVPDCVAADAPTRPVLRAIGSRRAG